MYHNTRKNVEKWNPVIDKSGRIMQRIDGKSGSNNYGTYCTAATSFVHHHVVCAAAALDRGVGVFLCRRWRLSVSYYSFDA